jgi:hypothetical protein
MTPGVADRRLDVVLTDHAKPDDLPDLDYGWKGACWHHHNGGGNVESSVVYSMGTALARAKDQRLPVALMVGNDWLHGRVLAVDGYGLVLETDTSESCVVRLEAVNAVRVESIAAQRTPHFSTMGAAS